MAMIMWYAFIFGMINLNLISGASILMAPSEEEKVDPGQITIEILDMVPMFRHIPEMRESLMMKDPFSSLEDAFADYDEDEDELDEMKEDMRAMSFMLSVIEESIDSETKYKAAEELDKISKYLNEMVKTLSKEDQQPSPGKNTKNTSAITTPSAIEVTIETPIASFQPIVKPPLPIQLNKKVANDDELDNSNEIAKSNKKVATNYKKKAYNDYDFLQKWVKDKPISIQELGEKNSKDSEDYKLFWIPK